MDTYFCYVHRDSKAVAELKILTCETEADLQSQVDKVIADYPGARLEVFLGDRAIATFTSDGRLDP